MMENTFSLVKGQAACIYINENDANYDGILLAANSFASDVLMVTGIKPQICTKEEELAGCVIAVGTMAQNSIIAKLVDKKVLSLDGIDGKWECYKTQLVDYNDNNITQVLAIAGSDKRGCIYGIYRLSRMIGVSPWVWFADVLPEKKTEIVLSKSALDMESKEPSVKYRGIFINDESPSFTGWAYGKFGGLNEKMYCNVFELILRMNGNYLWPAMWGNIFSEEGSEHPHDNIRMADAYGIVMGTSHHEPMCRAGEEWRYNFEKYTDHYNWDFASNREGITNFWRDGIARNKPYESIVTVGMRGEADSALAGGLQYNVDLLKDIINVQNDLLKEAGMQDVTKMLVVYKEVEEYWNGGVDKTTGKFVEGLKDWKEADGTTALDNTVIMLCEDNYGNVRSLPETDRKGGWGMYYHFDYNGGPRGYMWINVMQLEKTWEQLSETYEYGVRDIWIVNVGDLKPMEMQISYYMDLAYDFETYGTNPKITPMEYYKRFVKEQFSYGVSEEGLDKIAEVLAGYCKLNAICKPEYLREDVYSIDNYKEAQWIMQYAEKIKNQAEECKQLIPEQLKDAYYELIYYPAVATANMNELYIYYAYYLKNKGVNATLAEGFATLVDDCLKLDADLMYYYNNTMAGGKWKKMMSQPHIGYVSWNAENLQPPVVEHNASEAGKVSKEELLNIVMSDGVMHPTDTYVAIGAENYSSLLQGTLADGTKTQFEVIPNYGREKASLKAYPVTNEYIQTGENMESGCMDEAVLNTLPRAQYEFETKNAGDYKVRIYTGPSNHLVGNIVKLRCAVSVDGSAPQILNMLPNGYLAGNCWEGHWCTAVCKNCHVNECEISMTEGKHTLTFYGIDPGLLLEKIVVYRDELPKSYKGPVDDGVRVF